MTCVFCSIAAGDAPATFVNESEAFVAFADLHPKADTHVLIVPREHHEDLDAWIAAGGSSDAMLAFVAETARALDVNGRYRLITNVGAGAGQEVFHLHWHLLAGDDLPGF